MSNKIEKVLIDKFGEGTFHHLIENGVIQISNFNKTPAIFEKSKEGKIQEYIHSKIINLDTNEKVKKQINNNWGFDFPGWIGEIENGKAIMIIGQEPNIQCPPVQIVYGFHQNENEKSDDAAKRLIATIKLWYRISKLFEGHFGSQIEVLKDCYITDICHFAPSRSGTVKKINKLLGQENSQKWEEIRGKVMKKYLKEEIEALSPKVIVCQSSITYNAVTSILESIPKKEYQMPYPKKGYKIKFSTWKNQITILGLPHIGSSFNITDKFWERHLFEVKILINAIM